MMRALRISGPKQLALERVPEPARPGECRIRVRLAGICGTDLQLLEGYAGFAGTPGHEFVGVVEDVSGPEDAPWVGKRVVGEINVGCGACGWCRAGVKEHCPERTVLGIKQRDGAFAEFLSLPAANLHALPDRLNDEAAVFVEPVAAACRILEQVAVGRDTKAAVLGDGRMGLIVAQVIRMTGASVTLVGKHERKLEVARGLGLATAMAAGGSPARGAFGLVVDVTGRPEGLVQALDLVRPRGTVVLKSTFHGELDWTPWPAIVNEVTLVGSRCGPFAPAIDLLATGAVQVAPLISRVCPLDEFDAALTAARRELKVLFRP